MTAPLDGADPSADEIFDRYEKYFATSFPDLGNEPLPIEPYVSAAFFEKEKERIFSRAWVKVGHASEIPFSGDYFVKDMPVIGSSVIIVRGKDGVIRGFHNVCTHRANQLTQCERGRFKPFLTCPFHSWSFNTQGELKGIPEKDRFLNFDAKRLSLKPVAVECWGGFIFMNPNPQPEATLRDYLGSLATALDPYPFDMLEVAGSWTVDVDCNWKVLVDAFQEGYHVMSIHKHTQPSNFVVSRSGQNRLVNFRTHGSHRAVTVGGCVDPVAMPVEAVAIGLALPAFTRGLEPGEHAWKGLNPGQHPQRAFAFDINVVFPTTFIDVAQGFTFSYEFHPISVRRTRFDIQFLLPKATNWGEWLGMQMLMYRIRESLMEDLTTMESVQRGMESGAIESTVISDQEIAIRHHYREVQNWVARPL